MKKTNVVIIYTDQQSLWTVSAYGMQNFLLTPNIDKIAEEWLACEHFYTNANPCTPSRGTFLTGLYPSSHGAFHNNKRIDQTKKTFAHILQENGYKTGYIGKYHLDGESEKKGSIVPKSRGMGFEENSLMVNRGHYKKISSKFGKEINDTSKIIYSSIKSNIGDEESYPTDWFTSKSLEFIEIESKKDNPFCLMIGFPDPHPPYKTRSPYDKKFNPEDMPIPKSFCKSIFKSIKLSKKRYEKSSREGLIEEKILRRYKSGYCAMVKLIDDNVGRIIKKLKEIKIYENTLIAFTTDHGDFMGEHGLLGKSEILESAFRIPFLIKFPNEMKFHKNNKFLWSTVDFAPTLLELLKIKPIHKFDGKSYAKELLLDEKFVIDKEKYVFLETCTRNNENNRVGLINNEFWYSLNIANSRESLFDRVNDELQEVNLSFDPSFLEIKNKFRKILLDNHKNYSSLHNEWLNKLQFKDP